MLDASVQIFMIIERVVVEVYSRKRISLRIARYVSHQLKGWAANWLSPLNNVILGSSSNAKARQTVVGACQTLCSYYYGIMLLTRPFLIYELYEYLGASMRTSSTRSDHLEKEKFADAALDAAVAFVDTLGRVIATDKLPRRSPTIVYVVTVLETCLVLISLMISRSWLFTTSLVLAVGVLGRSGLSFEENCKASIRCLDYFATVDPHARQYSSIVKALLQTTTELVKKREQSLRSQRKQASSQLFGLLPLDTARRSSSPQPRQAVPAVPNLLSASLDEVTQSTDQPLDWTIYDADFFALPWSNENDEGLQDFLQPGRQTIDGSLADIPLFPMYDQIG
jgi:hypothetical protein